MFLVWQRDDQGRKQSLYRGYIIDKRIDADKSSRNTLERKDNGIEDEMKDDDNLNSWHDLLRISFYQLRFEQYRTVSGCYCVTNTRIFVTYRSGERTLLLL